MSTIIDPGTDLSYPIEVRELIGVTSDDITDDTLKLDLFFGQADRTIKKIVPNWENIQAGSDADRKASLRSMVIIQVGLLIISSPSSQNYLLNQVSITDDVTLKSNNRSYDDLKDSLQQMLDDQKLSVGIEYDEDYPTIPGIGKTDSSLIYKYEIDDNGNIVEAI